MRCVILETPYAGYDQEETYYHQVYARLCMLDCIGRDEAPFVSQLLYTQVLNDKEPKQRKIGMDAHHAWQGKADAMVVYVDRLISGGMQEAIEIAEDAGLAIEYRNLPLYEEILG